MFENGSSSPGAMKKVIEGEADFTVGMYALTPLRLKYMDSIKSHIGFPFVLIVPSGAELTPFEKLARPFQQKIWLLLSLTYFFGFWFIFVISRTRNSNLMLIIFGERQNPPMLNMLDISFGGSMHKLPKKSCPRLLLASFLLFCLVIRNLYQGLLFQFLQSDDRARPVMTIDEMIEKDFYFYMYSIYQEHTQHLKIDSRYEHCLFNLIRFQFKFINFQAKSLRLFRERKLPEKNFRSKL